MSFEKRNKLNQLHHLLPEGLVVDTGWLESKGYSSALRNRYLTSGWLERPARGVYRRPGGKLLWQQVVISLQMQNHLDVSVLVGGRTALDLQGFSHYISTRGGREVHLYGETPLPSWVAKLDLDIRFVFHRERKLFGKEPNSPGLASILSNVKDQSITITDPIHRNCFRPISWGQWDWSLALSMPERAILEMLNEIPERETFEQVDKIFDGLRTLSPRRLQKLLEECHNVKVKRLFLWYAERHNFRWLRQIDQSRIDLGNGKRMIARGGKLDTKYLITVPADLDGGQ